MGAFEHCDSDEFVLVLPATAANAAEVRHRFAEWLHTRAVPTSAIADVVLVVYEACANCVEHAYQDVAGGSMRINATPTTEGLVVRVTDYGTWQPPTDNLRGGRGIALMRTMSDTLTLTRTGSETTVTMQFRWAEESTAPSSQAGADINPPHSAAAEPPLQVSG